MTKRISSPRSRPSNRIGEEPHVSSRIRLGEVDGGSGKQLGRHNKTSVTEMLKGHLGGPLELRLRGTICCLDG